VLVRTAESWEGEPVTAQVETLQWPLDGSRRTGWRTSRAQPNRAWGAAYRRPRGLGSIHASKRHCRANGDRPSASSRPPRGLCASRPPWRFVACLPADFTEVGQCVSPAPAPPSVPPEAATKLVRHARPPSLQSQPTPVVIACPREEGAQAQRARRAAQSDQRGSSFRLEGEGGGTLRSALDAVVHVGDTGLPLEDPGAL
jgi:hypothetical protein